MVASSHPPDEAMPPRNAACGPPTISGNLLQMAIINNHHDDDGNAAMPSHRGNSAPRGEPDASQVASQVARGRHLSDPDWHQSKQWTSDENYNVNIARRALTTGSCL